MALELEWENYLKTGEVDEAVISTQPNDNENAYAINSNDNDVDISSKCSSLYISTKTKIAYLTCEKVDLNEIFWKIPIMPYHCGSEGVIKKQMKINTYTKEDHMDIQNKCDASTMCDQHVITHIDNPNGNIKFKNVQKISIGMCKKDILNSRCKKKGAFYNCFVLIMRLKDTDMTMNEISYKEAHVKVFNTGKLEIPGVKTDAFLEKILIKLVQILKPYINLKLSYDMSKTETVLVNSNFNCGYNINREVLFNKLKYDYGISALYDPCSYPGIQCKFYYNTLIDNNNGTHISVKDVDPSHIRVISFMIFRTGSVMIVGKCEDGMLYNLYNFLKNILIVEYKDIVENVCTMQTDDILHIKEPKLSRKKTITIIQKITN